MLHLHLSGPLHPSGRESVQRPSSVYGKRRRPGDALRQVTWIGMCVAGLLSSSGATGAAEPLVGTPVSVPVRGVTLFSSGVGFFEHVGKVSGEAGTELHFKTDQISDILKSLILEDLDGGTVGTVVYPPQDPVSKILRSFQVDITNNPSLSELLTQLRGARLKGQANAESFEGIILGLEKKKRVVGEKGQVIEVSTLNLLSETGVRSVLLDDVQRLEFEGARLQRELESALAALAEARDQAKKVVRVHFHGTGERRVRLGYVLETPIWKASYRLMLGDNEKEKPRIQGWAIVENQTDSDWNNVQLSLVSGRPISFIQPLYQPLYIPRPVVQPELYGGVRPQTYEQGTAPTASDTGRSGSPERGRALGMKDAQNLAQQKSLRQPGSDLPAAPATQEPADSIRSAAEAGEVGELFQYAVPQVTLSRQRSAMIPIVVEELEAERVSIFNAEVLSKHPLTGARLKNTTGKHLLQGPVTVFDGRTYAAMHASIRSRRDRIAGLAMASTNRFMSRNRPRGPCPRCKQAELSKACCTSAENGRPCRNTFSTPNAAREKAVLVEHPRRDGWKLVGSPTPIETTGTHYRFKEALPAG